MSWPFQVLLYLIEHRDRVVSRQELLESFWDGHDVYDETLTKCIGAIRKALCDTSEQSRFVATHWAEGYRYVGPCEEMQVDSANANGEVIEGSCLSRRSLAPATARKSQQHGTQTRSVSSGAAL